MTGYARRHGTAALALATFFLTGAAMAAVPVWPRFHGPQGDNISTETGLLKKWPPEGPKLLWTVEKLGFGYSSVTIAHDTIYTAGNVDERTAVHSPQRVLVRLRRESDSLTRPEWETVGKRREKSVRCWRKPTVRLS